ncbi:MAG: tetratricopeptide repeat protein [Phycisphaerales bacterium]
MSQPWRDPDESVEKAHECYEAGRWREAEELLRQALSQQPDRAEWHFNLGMTLEAAEKYAEAAEAFGDAAKHSKPEESTPWVACAVNHLRAEQPEKAVTPLERARRLDADRSDVFVHSIEAYSRTGRHDDAEEMFYRALQLEGHHGDAYANMGEATIERLAAERDAARARGEEMDEKRLRSGYERAAGCFRESMKLAASEEADDSRSAPPSRVAARLAYCLQRQGKLDEAREWYLRDLRENPGDADTLLDLGECLVESGRLAEAADKFRRVLELEPDHVDALMALGTLALRRNKDAAAAKRFARVLRLAPEHPEAGLRLARALLSKGDRARARATLSRQVSALRRARAEAAIDKKPLEPERWPRERLSELGALLLEAEMPRQAAFALARAVRMSPKNARDLHHLGVALLQVGMQRRGLMAERRAVRLDPTIPEAWHNLALAAIRDAKWARARVYLEKARALAPNDPNVRRLAALYRVERVVGPLRRLWPGRRRQA